MKTCFKCHQTKPLDEFYQHKMMSDGYLNKCKSCTKNDAREREHKLRKTDLNWLEKELERQRIKSQKRRDGGYLSPAQHLAKSVWAAKNRHKRRAHNAVSNAVRDGKIIPSVCEICGSEQTEAHHDDYSKPLDVRWLCKKHHMQVHIELNKIKRLEFFNSNKV